MGRGPWLGFWGPGPPSPYMQGGLRVPLLMGGWLWSDSDADRHRAAQRVCRGRSEMAEGVPAALVPATPCTHRRLAPQERVRPLHTVSVALLPAGTRTCVLSSFRRADGASERLGQARGRIRGRSSRPGPRVTGGNCGRSKAGVWSLGGLLGRGQTGEGGVLEDSDCSRSPVAGRVRRGRAAGSWAGGKQRRSGAET